jgi:hypothetical protein
MINLNSSQFIKSVMFGGLVFLFVLAFCRSYLRTHTTLTGYRLGDLKGFEAELLEKRSGLRMALATLTTKASLNQRVLKIKRGESVQYARVH